jgi:hypothetical protein
MAAVETRCGVSRFEPQHASPNSVSLQSFYPLYRVAVTVLYSTNPNNVFLQYKLSSMFYSLYRVAVTVLYNKICILKLNSFTLYFKVLFTIMKQDIHLEQIREIRSLMEKSTRFISLSGLSGVFAGIFALIGAAVAYYILDYGNIRLDSYVNKSGSENITFYLIADAIIVLILASISAYYFSMKRSKKMRIKFWNSAAKRMIINLLIPMATGGILIIILLIRNQVNFVAPFTLIFYGLGLISAGKYSGYDINYLGFTEIILGLLAMFFINNGLLFWAIGFGLFHIIYGLVLYGKYERTKAIRP